MADQVLFQTDDDLSQTNLARQLAATQPRGFVASGLSVSYNGSEVDVSGGLAFVRDSDSEAAYVASADARANLSISSGGYVWLDLTVSSNDSLSIVTTSSDVAPSPTSLKLARVEGGQAVETSRRNDRDIRRGELEDFLRVLTGARVLFGDQTQVEVYLDPDTNEWVVESDSGKALRFGDAGDLTVPGNLDVAGVLDLADLNTDDLSVADSFTVPSYADNSNATAENAEVWFNDGSGSSPAGLYYYDDGVIGPIATDNTSAPGKLSGLSIDTTKDFGGFSLTGMGHDEVDVPQTQELVADDFKRASLGSDYVGDTSDAQIQSSVALEGSRSLEISRSSTGSSRVGKKAETAPQLGDTITCLTQLTDTDDELGISTLQKSTTIAFFDDTSFAVVLRADNDELEVVQNLDGTKLSKQTVAASLSSNLNETITVEIELGTDRAFSVQVLDSTDTELASVTGTLDSRLPTSGNTQFRVNNANTATTVYVDGPFIERRTPQETSERQRGAREIAKTVSRGGVASGPPSAQPDERRRTIHRHPVTTDSEQGQRYVDAMTVGGSPVAYVEGEFDGNGGTYGDRFDAAISKLARLNADYHWQYDTLSQTNWNVNPDGETVQLNWDAGVVEISTDGDGSGVPRFDHPAGPTVDSAGPFAITFHDVDFTNNSDVLQLGLAGTPSANTNGDGVYFRVNSDSIRVVEDGSRTRIGGIPSTPSVADYTIAYDGTDLFTQIDGEKAAIGTLNRGSGSNTPLKPFLKLADQGTAETVTVSEISIRPTTEVLR